MGPARKFLQLWLKARNGSNPARYFQMWIQRRRSDEIDERDKRKITKWNGYLLSLLMRFPFRRVKEATMSTASSRWFRSIAGPGGSTRRRHAGQLLGSDGGYQIERRDAFQTRVSNFHVTMDLLVKAGHLKYRIRTSWPAFPLTSIIFYNTTNYSYITNYFYSWHLSSRISGFVSNHRNA